MPEATRFIEKLETFELIIQIKFKLLLESVNEIINSPSLRGSAATEAIPLYSERLLRASQ